MRTKAAVLAGKKQVYLQEFDLPPITDDELLVKIVSNSKCLSTYKAALLGEEHKRVPNDIQQQPIITGHEFAGIIVAVGSNLAARYQAGEAFVLQPAMGLPSGYSAGYSYPHFGGNATYCIIPKIAIDLGCVLPYQGNYFANGSLSEPMSCIIGAFHASYHTTPYVYQHEMGIKAGGALALLGCAGPMGIGAIDYAVNGPYHPSLIVVTDIDETRIQRAKSLISVEAAAAAGIVLHYVNTKDIDAVQTVLQLNDGNGYDDVFVFAASDPLLQQADDLLGEDGCLNFFAGPTNHRFKVPFNFYNVHYGRTHIVGTSGGSTADMIESLELSAQGKINPSYMITHIGGLQAAPDTILRLPELPGGKKLIYPHVELDLTAIEDFEKLGKDNELFCNLAQICKEHNQVWNQKAEHYLLSYFDAK